MPPTAKRFALGCRRTYGRNWMKIRKTLCGLSRKEIEDNLDSLGELVSNAKYICRRCARVSGKKKHLCKPVKLESIK